METITIQKNKLPDGWEVKRLGEVAEYINGRAFKPKEWGKKGRPIIRIQNLTKSTDKVNYYDGDYEEKHFVKNGDILLAWSATLDIFEWNEVPALLNQHIFNVKVNKNIVHKKYFFYYIKNIIEKIKGRTHGTGMTHITKPMLLSMNILVPPLKTQYLIVSKLDAFFESYNKLKQEKQKAKEKYEQILQSAIAGFILRGDWEKKKLGDICVINPKKKELENLPENYEVSFIPMSFVDEKEGIIKEQEVKKLKEVKKGYTYFKENDVLFAKITPCMENGKAAIARNLKNGIGFGSTEFHVIRPSENLLADYIFYFVRQPFFRKEAASNMSGTAGQLRVPATFLENYEIPIIPIDEQKKLISLLNKVKEYSSLIFEYQKTIDFQLTQLPKSVLSKAFKGELI